jgi:N-acetylglucosamine-6-sulfatase
MEINQLVLNIDLAPTLLEYGGAEKDSLIDGASLVPLMKGMSPKDWRTYFYIEYYSDKVWPRMVNMGYQGIRSTRYKYIQYMELENMDELYDLEVDPYELNNVIQHPDYQEIVEELKLKLKKY